MVYATTSVGIRVHTGESPFHDRLILWKGPAVKIVVGISGEDREFIILKQAVQCFRPTEVILVHAIDLGLYFELSVAVEDGEDAGRHLLEKAAGTVAKDVKIIRKVNESANPADLILETTEREDADLVVVGTRGRSRLTEAFVGSVSARVFLHTSRSTLVVKGAVRKVERVLVAVEGPDDADRIVAWLRRHPLKDPAELRVVHAVAPGGIKDATGKSLSPAEAHQRAEQLVGEAASTLAQSSYKVSTKVAAGKPVALIEEQAKGMDLVVVSSHGRTGMSRFLVGSVSHSVVHDVACSVLIVR